MKSKPPPADPDERSLREAAMAHLARYEATRDGLLRVLDRRIARWARAQDTDIEGAVDAARAAARRVADALASSGALDDGRFATRRASLHARSGRSARLSRVLLGAAGVPAPLAEAASARDPALELEAAVAHARKRRLGPFGPEDADRRRALASFARAGFGSETARRVLALDRDEAEQHLIDLRARD